MNLTIAPVYSPILFVCRTQGDRALQPRIQPKLCYSSSAWSSEVASSVGKEGNPPGQSSAFGLHHLMRGQHDELRTQGRRSSSSKNQFLIDPFDFDARRFTDFSKPKYRKVKKLLDQIVLKNPPEENIEPDCNADGFDSSGMSEGYWFEHVHHSHEPSSPLPSAGPLLSSEDLRDEPIRVDSTDNFESTNSRQVVTPSVAAGTSAQKIMNRLEPLHSSSSAHMSPNVSVLRPGGRLRAKPGRVLASRPSEHSRLQSHASTPSKRSSPMLSFDSSLSSYRDMMISDESMQGSPLRHSPLMASLATPQIPSSPVRRHHRSLFAAQISQEPGSVQRGSPLTTVGHSDRFRSEDNWTDGRISSLPSLEGWLAEESRSSLLHMALEEVRDTNPPSPMRIDEGPSEMMADSRPPILGLRKLGLGSRPERVQLPPPPSHENSSANSTRIPSPSMKRIRTEPTAFTQAPAPSLPPKPPARPGNVRIDDLKKILAEHNQRIRPRKR